MRIGLDYGGVMDNDPESWIDIIKSLINKEYEVFIISHAHPGLDEQKRQTLAEKSGAINLSFSDTMDESIIEQRKAQLVSEYKIDLMVEDYMNRCAAIHKTNPQCGFICIHYSNQSFTQKIIKALGEYYV